ncbi:uncharacterized protein METZ01_LOCUS111286, partial [marine metagenome]
QRRSPVHHRADHRRRRRCPVAGKPRPDQHCTGRGL